MGDGKDEAELDINMDLDIDIEEEEEDDNGGFKIEMVDVGNLQAVVGTGTYSILGGDDDEDEDEDGNNKGGEFDSRIITSLDWSSRQVPRNSNGNGHKEDVSMCNVSGFNINVPSTPASMSHASSKRTTGTTPRASLSKMRASLRGVNNNNNNHPQGVRSGNRAQHSTIEEVDDEEHDGTTEPELDSEEDSEEEEQQENKVRKTKKENCERREGS